MPSLLTLLDDIVSTLDDVSAMTKVALRKTSALMTDDLAVNSGVIHGVTPDKELPMVWRIFVGSLLNKVVCIVGVLVLLAVYPPVLTVILFIGGLYLAYEGAHKVHEKLFHKDKGKKDSQKLTEKQKVRGAEENQITVILVTHDLNVAKHAKRILVLRDGLIQTDTRSFDEAFQSLHAAEAD